MARQLVVQRRSSREAFSKRKGTGPESEEKLKTDGRKKELTDMIDLVLYVCMIAVKIGGCLCWVIVIDIPTDLNKKEQVSNEFTTTDP